MVFEFLHSNGKITTYVMNRDHACDGTAVVVLCPRVRNRELKECRSDLGTGSRGEAVDILWNERQAQLDLAFKVCCICHSV